MWIETLECDSCAHDAVEDKHTRSPRRDQIRNLYDLDGCAFLVSSPGASAEVFKLSKDEAETIATSTHCHHVCADCMNKLPVKLFDKTEIPSGAAD